MLRTLPRRATLVPPALSTEIRIYRNVLNRKTEGGGGGLGDESVCEKGELSSGAKCYVLFTIQAGWVGGVHDIKIK